MKLRYSEMENGIRLLKLSGALDLAGTRSIEVEFVRRCAGENARVLVDLSKVNYISSIGIPLLINTAKSLSLRNGRMVLLNPQRNVADVLEMTGIPLIIPTFNDSAAAVSALTK
ncbi:MAG: anti-sigma factor antagonist [Anaerolineales bacterium]|nr:STAS domain-containing protein [Anaerolineae bacterium]PWB75252.1 MAG: anti-sigma factor antagonist [Anaerolineales bacterium]